MPSRAVGHQAGVLEHLQVLRHRRPADRELVRELADRQRAGRQALEDRAARRIPQRVHSVSRPLTVSRRLTNARVSSLSAALPGRPTVGGWPCVAAEGAREDLRGGPRRAPGARRRLAPRRAGRGRGDPRALGHREVDAAAPDRRARPAGRGHDQGRGRAGHRRGRAGAERGCGAAGSASSSSSSTCCPSSPARRTCCWPAACAARAPDAAARGRALIDRLGLRDGRRLAAAPALRRRAAALRDRPRAGQRPGGAARRRADRQPRRRGRRRGAAAAARRRRRGPRGRDGHARDRPPRRSPTAC